MNPGNPADFELLALVLVIAGGFAATNLDNLLILVGLLAATNRQRPRLLAAFMAAAGTVLALALLGTFLGRLLSPNHLGYLGVIPLTMGGYLLLGTLRLRAAGAPVEVAASGTAGGAVGTYLLMVANSGDSIALFVPLFAESSRYSQLVEVLVYILMVCVWSVLAHLAVGQPGIATVMQRFGAWLAPVIMIGVGAYILMDTATDTLQ